jgi:hypothetical protein
MQSPTTLYDTCQSQIKSCDFLLDNLLKKSPLDTDLQVEDEIILKAYVLLCHAAIEEYLEMLAEDALKLCLRKFKIENKITRPVVALIASGILLSDEYAKFGIDKQTKGQRTRLRHFVNDMSDILDRSFGRYKDDIIADNHGVKLANLENLFLPLGINIDVVLGNQLTAFGDRRGAFAHSFKVKHVVTPSMIVAEVNLIVSQLKVLDEQVCESTRDGMSPW